MSRCRTPHRWGCKRTCGKHAKACESMMAMAMGCKCWSWPRRGSEPHGPRRGEPGWMALLGGVGPRRAWGRGSMASWEARKQGLLVVVQDWFFSMGKGRSLAFSQFVVRAGGSFCGLLRVASIPKGRVVFFQIGRSTLLPSSYQGQSFMSTSEVQGKPRSDAAA